MASKRIVFIVGAFVMSTVLLETLLTKPVNKGNTTLITGTYGGIQKNDTRGSISYEIYLQGIPGYYRIGADGSYCFNYQLFTTQIHNGDEVRLYVNNGSFIKASSVVSVMAGSTEYLSFNCINQNAADNKVKLPIMCAGALVIIVLIFYFKKNRNDVPVS